MNIQPTEIPDVLLITPKVFGDKRGFFKETYRASSYAEMGIKGPFVQDNHSGSEHNILRGLHYQIRHAQGKLVWVVRGEIYDVALDLRRGRPTFGKWVGAILSEENHQQIWIPPGFAHGFYVLSEWAEVVYKVTDIYAPKWERTILWNDSALDIPWPLQAGSPILSEKDQNGKRFAEAEVYE